MSVGTGRAVAPTGHATGRALRRLTGKRIAVLNWRDVRHPQSGGAEHYIHEIARRWVTAGASVTMLTACDPGSAARETIDGIDVRRAGGTLSVYPRTALRLGGRLGRVDAVVDCQNGIPFFSPLVLGPAVPVVQVVHHVHQDQFATRFGPVMARVGRMLEGPVARRAYLGRRSVAVSASTRQEMRARLGFTGIIDIVPNGGRPAARHVQRAATPTIAVVSRLVPHKRVDLLLDAVEAIARWVPGLRTHVIGAGPELPRLHTMVAQRGLGATVTLHGRVDDATRDALLSAAWLTASTSAGEGWGLSIMEAAAAGVPCVALRVPGVRDSVVDGRTGWLVEEPAAFADAIGRALGELAEPVRARRYADACRTWAGRFTWDRSADLLAATVLAEIDRGRHPHQDRKAGTRRRTRTDQCTFATFHHPDPAQLAELLRLTDEASWAGPAVRAVLRGCDDVDALTLLERLGATDVRVRPADRHELLGGPADLPGTDS